MKELHQVTKWVREELSAHADPEYKKFHEALVPGLDTMLGVRIPKLREIGKKAAKMDYWNFVSEADTSVYEELMLRGMAIGYGKLSKEEQKAELRRFVPLINNWAICDCSCATFQFMKKDQEEWFRYLLGWLETGREYEIRFSVVCMLDFFINERFLRLVLKSMGEIRQEGYYVKMAVAWAVSVCYVKFPQETEAFLLENRLDDFTHNKAIQKIRESLRVSKEDKERLNTYKRPAKGKRREAEK